MEYLKSISIGLFATFLWLGTAFCVAFPEHVINLEIETLANSYVSGVNYEKYFIPALLLVDIMITSMVTGLYLTTKQKFFIGTAVLVYCLVAGMIPTFRDDNATGGAFLFVVALICLSIPRYCSFITSKPFTPVNIVNE